MVGVHFVGLAESAKAAKVEFHAAKGIGHSRRFAPTLQPTFGQILRCVRSNVVLLGCGKTKRRLSALEL